MNDSFIPVIIRQIPLLQPPDFTVQRWCGHGGPTRIWYQSNFSILVAAAVLGAWGL